MKDLEKTAILVTEHILRTVLMQKDKLFIKESIIIYSTIYCKWAGIRQSV
jgi:hypothetical protein